MAWLTVLPALWAPNKCQEGWSYLFQALGLCSSYHQGCLYFKRTPENIWVGIRMQNASFPQETRLPLHPQRFISLEQCLQSLPKYKMHFYKPTSFLPRVSLQHNCSGPSMVGKKATSPAALLVKVGWNPSAPLLVPQAVGI